MVLFEIYTFAVLNRYNRRIKNAELLCRCSYCDARIAVKKITK